MAAKKKQAKVPAAALHPVPVNCRNTRPGQCPESASDLGDMVGAWAKEWQYWWAETQEALDDCPDIEVTPANINFTVCRAIRAIHIDWCTWAEVLRATQEKLCPGPSGHIPKPPDPPF